MATISLEQVTKIYPNGFQAIHELDLEVADGEFMVLVGPSGCGKTTALRMVAGLEDITYGKLRIGDRVVNDASPRDRDIAMVFQNYSLYPHMTVAANIGFALQLRKLPKTVIRQKVDDTVELLGLTECKDHKPGQLSGGQRQRVAMGRAIVREPSVFLMDEPLSNLDAKLRVQMRTEVLRIQRRLGVATLYVTHDQTEAMTMGDRVAVLHRGLLQQLASPQTLYDRPANLFVASFMGSPAMNLYEGSVSGPAEQLIVTLGSQKLTLPPRAGRNKPALVAGDGRSVIVGVRPEHLSLGPAEGNRSLTADVELVEALGNELLVHFVTDAKTAHPDRALVSADDPVFASGEVGGADTANGVSRVDPRTHVKAGERVTFAVDVEALHFFDPQTGATLDEVPA